MEDFKKAFEKLMSKKCIQILRERCHSILKKLKILHLIKSLGRGGAEKLIPQTAALHNKDQFEFFCLYFFHQENNIIDELEDSGIQVFHLPSGNLGLFFQVKKVRDFVATHQIDIIHAHLPWAGILARLAGKEMEVPIVYTEHNTWDRYNLFSYWGNRLTFKQQDAAIAVSNEVSLSMQLNLIFDPLKIPGRMRLYSIPNGVNTEEFQRSWEDRETIRKAWKIPLDAFVVGKVAVFRSQKRLWIWVEQALEILKKTPQTHFLLVGDGDWRSRILSQIKSSGKAANFHWAGVQKEVRPFLSAMDLYMSSSEFEGLPIAMLEAMACHLPVVATRAGGIGEVITHGVEGYLCEIEDYQQLAPLALKIIQDPDLHQSFSQAARQRVVQDFSMQQMVKALETVYFQVLEKSEL